MKKIIGSRSCKLLVALCLILSLSVSLFAFEAFAVSTTPSAWTVNKSGSVSIGMGDTVTAVTARGTVPSWASASYSGSNVIISGTPTAAGSYTLEYDVTLAGGTDEVIVNLTVNDAAPAVTVPLTTPTPETTTVPVTTTAPSTKFEITKHPTAETVYEGHKATFIARANNATGFTWRLVSSDASNTILARDAEYYFKGLHVYGTTTDTLVLDDIPASLNGWYVECKFDGPGGPLYTKGARISVVGVTTTVTDPLNPNGTTNTTTNGADPVVPTITSQPKGASLSAGQTTTLSTTATINDGGTLKYQWYTNKVNSTAGGEAVTGATNPQYQPPQKEGARYYYCAVWNSKDNKSSTVIYTTPVEVIYNIQGNSNVVNNSGSTGNTGSTNTGNTGNTTNVISGNNTVPSTGTNNTTVSSTPIISTINTPSLEEMNNNQQNADTQQTQEQQAQTAQKLQQDENNGSSVATTLLVVLGILAVGLIAAIVFIFLKNGRKI